MASALVMLLLSAVTTLAAAQQRNSSIINLGSSLTPSANSSWVSPSGIFAFGFYQQPQNSGYAICIFFTSSSERMVVWTAESYSPYVPDSAILLLTNDGRLILQDKGSQYIYFEISSIFQTVAWASMLDNGNFVLYNSDGRAIWQSFDEPTDTVLPGQRLSPGAQLLSKASETNVTRGIFRLKMQPDGNLVQYPADSPDTYEYAYYSSNTGGGGGPYNNVSLNLENDGRLYLSTGTSVLLNLTTGLGERYGVGRTTYLMRIDADGVFRLYSKGSTWRSIWSSTEDKCAPKGVCGQNSFCTYLDGVADCKCLPGFDFVQSGDRTAGCARNFVLESCTDKNLSAKYETRRVPNVNWEENSYATEISHSEEDCRRACLGDCYCDAAFFRDGQCRKQRFPLRYGRRLPIYSDIALVKVRIHGLETTGASYNSGSDSGLSNLQKYVIIGVSLGIASLVTSIMVFYVKCRLHDHSKGSNQNVDIFLLNHVSLAPKRYSYKEIKKITKSFTEKLGQGGYGIVYKGNLPDGQFVAVKVLIETSDNAEDFINEVASISRTSHVNIVNLLGFCYERKRRALVYEFMPNKSLEKFIYKSVSDDAECSLEREKLYEIAIGIARGLEYLHRGCNMRIVHFDIKPQNILLDEDFCPKISDFGLAKLVKKKQSKISMLGARGTIGYIAPEVFSRNFGAVSHKSDVYSYGMMLLEMGEARRFSETEVTQSSDNYFPDKIYEHVLLNSGDVLIEEREETKRKMLLIGLWCIQTAPSDRPSMTKVVEMLEGSLHSIQIPPKPFLHSPNLSEQQFSSSFPINVKIEHPT